MLTDEQVEFYDEHGYVHIPEVFTQAETEQLGSDIDRLVAEWATTSKGWSGPWRKVYMDEETEKASQLTAIHDLHLYSNAWCRAVTNPRLTRSMAALIGPDVELHHSTMHIKPPQAGHPFPMHQDHPFYQHENGRYVDVLVHVDDTCEENGNICFLDGSHQGGALEHITMTEEGPSAPHLPTSEYRLEDAVPVPARKGDVVCFSIHTIHGSPVNRTKSSRRLVRVGYRDPENVQTAGQSLKRPGLMVQGYRKRAEGQELLPQ